MNKPAFAGCSAARRGPHLVYFLKIVLSLVKPAERQQVIASPSFHRCRKNSVRNPVTNLRYARSAMTLVPRLTIAFTVVLTALALWLAPVQGHAASTPDAVLMVDQVSGGAGVQRNGKRLPLVAGDVLQEQDTLLTTASGRITLRLGRHGFVEVGPQSEIGIERLPFAAYARDLKSIFSVGKGYFRVVWKHPQISTSWPLYIYMAGNRISLVSGEYFFQNDGGAEQRACVAAGQLALQTANLDGVETIKAPSCTRLMDGAAPQTTARNPDDWIAVRRAYDIAATALTLPGAANVVAVPAASVAQAIAPPAFSTAAGTNTFASSVAAPPATPPENSTALPDYGTPALPPAVGRSPAGPVKAAPVIAAAPPKPTVQVPSLPVEAPPLAISPPLAAPIARAPTAAPPAAAATGWALNIASYADESPARQQAQKLREAGYRAATFAAVVNGRTWYRVQVQGFASEPAARTAIEALQARFGLKGIWIVRPS